MKIPSYNKTPLSKVQYISFWIRHYLEKRKDYFYDIKNIDDEKIKLTAFIVFHENIISLAKLKKIDSYSLEYIVGVIANSHNSLRSKLAKIRSDKKKLANKINVRNFRKDNKNLVCLNVLIDKDLKIKFKECLKNNSLSVSDFFNGVINEFVLKNASLKL